MALSGSLIEHRRIITPFHARTEQIWADKKYTYGVGPAGYDVRIEFDANGRMRRKVLYPGDFILASTIEHFNMPEDIIGEVKDKSSWARRGITVQNTVIEPGWRGHLTLEITNHGQEVITIHRGMPIAQIIFDGVVGQVTPYSGKYQDQKKGPQEAI